MRIYIIVLVMTGIILMALTACGVQTNPTNTTVSTTQKPVETLTPASASPVNPNPNTEAKQEERFVLPTDGGKSEASFNAFREKLIEASKKRDAKYILSIVDPKIKNSFGGDNGIEEFKDTWKIDRPDSKFWGEFLAAITNGGILYPDKTAFSAPYLFDGWPDGLDVFEHQAIFGKDIKLFAEPDPNSKVVATLSYNVVKTDHDNSIKKSGSEDEYTWLKVETLGGNEGFVKADSVRSSIDYRALFDKNDGKWMMTAFIAGD